MPDSSARPGSDAEWEALLRRLRQQAAAPPPPYLYARIQARLAARPAAPLAWVPNWLRRSAYALAIGGLVLAVSGDGAGIARSSARVPAPRQAQ